jgi:mannose-6-phosphate isomerase
MTSEQGAVTEAITSLVSRLEAKQQQGGGVTEKEALALRLNSQYPGGDVGVLSCFFLNLVRAASLLLVVEWLGSTKKHHLMLGSCYRGLVVGMHGK